MPPALLAAPHRPRPRCPSQCQRRRRARQRRPYRPRRRPQSPSLFPLRRRRRRPHHRRARCPSQCRWRLLPRQAPQPRRPPRLWRRAPRAPHAAMLRRCGQPPPGALEERAPLAPRPRCSPAGRRARRPQAWARPARRPQAGRPHGRQRHRSSPTIRGLSPAAAQRALRAFAAAPRQRWLASRVARQGPGCQTQRGVSRTSPSHLPPCGAAPPGAGCTPGPGARRRPRASSGPGSRS
mmetsp:Transcript_28616/g.89190  ORF Transcript_28616/g.89190 Transcript_28616/m.89190 type:complete len:237 (+) Transcript_28616:622-1332(+)